MPYDDIIERHARRAGVNPAWMHAIMRIESGGDPQAVTGSYKGLFQLSEREFRRHGGAGNVHDPDANTAAAANKLAQEARDFRSKTGRDPKLIDLYMIHQQGESGYGAHLANPDKPAWENVRGFYKSEATAKQAIWGNLPASDKARLGSVENVTSRDFVNAWGSRVEGEGPEFMEAGEIKDKTASLEEPRKRRKTILGEEEFRAPRIDFNVPNLTPDMEPIGRRGIV